MCLHRKDSIQANLATPLATTLYSLSVLDQETTFCLDYDHEIKLAPKKIQ